MVRVFDKCPPRASPIFLWAQAKAHFAHLVNLWAQAMGDTGIVGLGIVGTGIMGLPMPITNFHSHIFDILIMSEQRNNSNTNNFPIFNPIHSDQDHAINHDKTRSEPNTGNGNSVTGNGNSVRVSVSSDDDTGSEVDIVQEEQEEIT